MKVIKKLGVKGCIFILAASLLGTGVFVVAKELGVNPDAAILMAMVTTLLITSYYKIFYFSKKDEEGARKKKPSS